MIMLQLQEKFNHLSSAESVTKIASKVTKEKISTCKRHSLGIGLDNSPRIVQSY
jgi:hypothetical protein